jgi:hypothetical protein
MSSSSISCCQRQFSPANSTSPSLLQWTAAGVSTTEIWLNPIHSASDLSRSRYDVIGGRSQRRDTRPCQGDNHQRASTSISVNPFMVAADHG